MFAKLRKKNCDGIFASEKMRPGRVAGLSAHPAVTDGEVFCISSLKMQDLTRCGGGSIAGKPSECACACRNVRTGNGERNKENSPVECHSSSPEDAGICHFRPKSVHNSSERIKCCTESYAVTCVGVFSFLFL